MQTYIYIFNDEKYRMNLLIFVWMLAETKHLQFSHIMKINLWRITTNLSSKTIENLFHCFNANTSFNVRIEISLFKHKIQVIIIRNISQIRSCRNKNMIKLFERNQIKIKIQRKPHFVSQPNASICWVKSLVFMVWKIYFKEGKKNPWI